MASRNCRFCTCPLHHTFVDLGMSPLSNSYVKPENLEQAELFYPLHSYVCEQCYLVQLPEFVSPQHIFGDYAYFSSYSDSWLAHARRYAEAMIAQWRLGPTSLVLEVASNDGYLLQYFQRRAIPVLGVEPAANVARVAQAAGIPTMVRFFGVATARDLVAAGQQADLLIGNNVLGHVPDLNDFVGGLKIVLKPRGILTMEFPHLLRLIEGNQFDTIYHEHFSYWSLLAIEKVFALHGLTIFDVEEVPTHGGSLRIFVSHAGNELPVPAGRVAAVRDHELSAGLHRMSTYAAFTEQVQETKRQLLQFLVEARRNGKRLAGYGAPAKGNTLLNYCGIRTDFLEYTVDRSKHKQGLFLPGVHVPIFHPEKLQETRPDYVLVLAWNLRDEIMEQLSYVREWGGAFVIPIPRLEVVP